MTPPRVRPLALRALAFAAAALAAGACSRAETPAASGHFLLYEGATLDAGATDAANSLAARAGQADKVSRIYMTPDAYDAVAGFYLAHGAEASVPPLPPGARHLPDGTEIRRVVVILDGARDLKRSNLWVVVQRPYVGSAREEGGKPVFEDVRDLTTIAVVERQ